MSQSFKTIGQARFFAITLWFIMVIVVSHFNSSVLAGITFLLVTFLLVAFYSGTKAQIMGQARSATKASPLPQISPEANSENINSAAPAETLPPSLSSSSGLTKCPDCDREVSRRAASCPNCGCPIAALQPNSGITEITTPSINIGVPTCPTCKSANVAKISLASKAGKVALVGVFAVGKVSKTFKCNACGYEW